MKKCLQIRQQLMITRVKFENTYVFVKALKATQFIIDDSSGQETIQLDKDS